MPVECPTCHQTNNDNDDFCSFCGTRLVVPLIPVTGGLSPIKPDLEAAPSPPAQPAVNDVDAGPSLQQQAAASTEFAAHLEVEGGQEIFFRGTYTTKVPLKSGSILIGRRDVMANHYPDIDLMMYRKLDPAISRRHLRFFKEDGDYFVEDLCNNNATFLNDYSEKLNHERRKLEDGDRIFVSMSLALLFRLPD